MLDLKRLATHALIVNRNEVVHQQLNTILDMGYSGIVVDENTTEVKDLMEMIKLVSEKAFEFSKEKERERAINQLKENSYQEDTQ